MSFFQLLFKLLEGRTTVTGGRLAGWALLDVATEVKEVLLARPQGVIRQGVHPGQRELFQVRLKKGSENLYYFHLMTFRLASILVSLSSITMTVPHLVVTTVG